MKYFRRWLIQSLFLLRLNLLKLISPDRSFSSILKHGDLPRKSTLKKSHNIMIIPNLIIINIIVAATFPGYTMKDCFTDIFSVSWYIQDISIRNPVIGSRKMSFLSKIKNIKSFADFKQKVRGNAEVFRRNASFVIHDWLVSLIHRKHRNNVFDFNISHCGAGFIGSHEDADQLVKVLGSSNQ